MPQKFMDHTGVRYGMLVGVKRASPSLPNTKWVFRCDCGTEKVMDARNVKFRAGSCGCKQGNVLHGEIAGRKVSYEYAAWQSMRQRCHNPKCAAYKHYGARGIRVCAKWRENFHAFLKDMGRRPSPSLSLDRINNNKGYSPSNCRWATKAEQSSNTRRNRFAVIDGRRDTITGHHANLGSKVDMRSVTWRINNGWDIKAAITTPTR